MVERVFKFRENQTTFRREVVAGLTTFAAMAYILMVHPDMLAKTGMDRGALLTATALVSAIGTLLAAFLTNYPIALAPGMGLNAFFTFGICIGMNIPWQGALGMVFWTGILFVILSLSGVRSLIVEAIPECLKIGIQAGIGLFIALIGFQNAGIVVDHPETLITLGPISDGWLPNSATLALLGLVIAVVLMVKQVPGASLIAILTVTLVGLFVPAESGTVTGRPDGIVGLPHSIAPVFFEVDWLYPFKNWHSAWMIVVTLLFVDLFDSMGTLIAVTRRGKFTDEKGNLPKLSNALLADAAATAVGACLGSSPVTAYIESATGIEAGGRTGLTGVVVAFCFLLTLFFAPILLIIPAAATAPALILVGVLMLSGLRSLDWDDLADSAPGILTAMLIPLCFSIANGIALGCITYCLLMTASGQKHRIHWLLGTLSVLFAIKFAIS
ncbi:MAG: NCS2 family permease [Verrucomicrobiales bacterium]|nr:NCS2 family permease [Verrucomicrobiales bacterium]